MKQDKRKEEMDMWEAVSLYLDDTGWPHRDAKPSVSTPLWCKGHKYAWQYEVDDTSKMHVYGDFPSIGLDRKKCPQCNGKKVRVIRDEDEY